VGVQAVVAREAQDHQEQIFQEDLENIQVAQRLQDKDTLADSDITDQVRDILTQVHKDRAQHTVVVVVVALVLEESVHILIIREETGDLA
jgi:hypothetical protein